MVIHLLEPGGWQGETNQVSIWQGNTVSLLSLPILGLTLIPCFIFIQIIAFWIISFKSVHLDISANSNDHSIPESGVGGSRQFAAFFLKAACPFSYGLWLSEILMRSKFVLVKQLHTCTLSHPHTQIWVLLLISRQATLDISPGALSQWPLIGAGPHLTEGLILQVRLKPPFLGPTSGPHCLYLPHQCCSLEVLTTIYLLPFLALSGHG